MELRPSTAEGTGFIPVQITKIPHVEWRPLPLKKER